MGKIIIVLAVIIMIAALAGCGGGGGSAIAPQSNFSIRTERWQGSWVPVVGTHVNVGDVVNFYPVTKTKQEANYGTLGGPNVRTEVTMPDGRTVSGSEAKDGFLIGMAGKVHVVVTVDGETPATVDLNAVMPSGIVPVYALSRQPLIRRDDGSYICPVNCGYIMPTIDGTVPWGETFRAAHQNGNVIDSPLVNGADLNGFGFLQPEVCTVTFPAHPERGSLKVEALSDFIGKG